MPFTLPANLSYDGSRDRDSVNYQTAGHTPAAPKIVIFDRKVPTATAPKEMYRVRVVRGAADVKGNVLVPGINVEFSVSSHMLASTADVTAAVTQLIEIITAEGFTAMAVESQLLPR